MSFFYLFMIMIRDGAEVSSRARTRGFSFAFDDIPNLMIDWICYDISGRLRSAGGLKDRVEGEISGPREWWVR